MQTKILIVEDQFIEANNLRRILEKSGYFVYPIARSVALAKKLIDAETPDMVMVDIFLKGDLTGIDLAIELRQKGIGFIYISANSNKQILDQAKATHPYGFLVKPFREKDVLVMLDVAQYLHKQNLAMAEKKSPPPVKSFEDMQEPPLRKFISQSPQMLDTLNQIKVVAPTDTSVLIQGESGTGKELVARAIHDLSSRAGMPLVIVNCGALPPNLIESELFGHEKGAFTGALQQRIGKFEQANGGTIFLDEIGELPLGLQVKFLRALQEKTIERLGGTSKKVDIRIIAATNKDLETEVAAGLFRLDLYYRLNIFPITLTPLRNRKEDILPLAHHFLQQFAAANHKTISGFSQVAESALLAYHWPGNVRQLEHLMERTVLLSSYPLIETIPLPVNKTNPAPSTSTDALRSIEDVEREHIISVLKHCNWRVSGPEGAAEILKINVNTLNSRMKKLGIEKFKS